MKTKLLKRIRNNWKVYERTFNSGTTFYYAYRKGKRMFHSQDVWKLKNDIIHTEFLKAEGWWAYTTLLIKRKNRLHNTKKRNFQNTLTEIENI